MIIIRHISVNSIFIATMLIILGISIQVNQASIVSAILNLNNQTVYINETYAMTYSVVSMGIILFFIGCCILLIEYIFVKLSSKGRSECLKK